MGSTSYSELAHSPKEDYDKRKKKKQRTEEVDDADDLKQILPDEIILEFISRLPLKSLMRCTCVKMHLLDIAMV
ncbi:hypothetical protein MKX03_009408 [Papaver bracteatum]|nr:hypothetical protein MKX03_009408 [Papaver bracteatum]